MPSVFDCERKVRVGPDGVVIERRMRTDNYLYAHDIVDALIGGVKLIGGELVRTPPHRDPLLPWCFCVDATLDGIGPYTSSVTPAGETMLDIVPTYAGAWINATYRTLDYNPLESQGPGQTAEQEIELASEKWHHGVQHKTLRDGGFIWRSTFSSGKQELVQNEGNEPVKIIPRSTFTLTRNFVLRPPHEAIRKLTGKVNGVAFGKAANQIPVETLLFESAEISHRTTNKGNLYSVVTYIFHHLPVFETINDLGEDNPSQGYVGWNRTYRESKRWWERVVMFNDLDKSIYDYDTTVVQSLGGQNVAGFKLLFHPRAT